MAIITTKVWAAITLEAAVEAPEDVVMSTEPKEVIICVMK
jgi:hypothetical protein